MIWPLFQLLALTVAAHEFCQGPDGTSTPCARPHKAGWLMPVRNPDVDQPTAAPTLARHRPSVRTATNEGPGSTSVTSAISVVAATTQASGVCEDRAGTTSVTGDDTGSETAQAQAAPTAVVNIPSPIDDNATGIETDPREGDAAGQDTRLSTATGTDGRAVVADHPNAADQVRNTAASGSGVLSESQESPKVDYSSGLPINTTAREGEPSNSTTADHNLTMLPSMINTTTNGNAAETERLTPDSSSVSTGHAALPSTKLPIASKETSALPNPIPTKAPTKHKYNYASPDCGARIQSSSPASQHASGVLHKSRDRYMLTPCKADQHWVTIELCDEIRVEAVEVAVWEYFSGVVREVRVSAGGDEEEGEGEMEEVGMFTGRNVRGAQTFTLHRPTSFSRFLRIDFPSYYGSEYYCPVSQIKVYGMNQLEAYKWEQRQVSASSSTVAAAQGTAIAHAAFNRSNDSNTIRRGTGDMGELEKLVHAAARTARDPLPSPEDIINNSGVNASITATATADKAPRRDRSDSESIYAFITRRLADLEGNSTLVLRYIDEQTRLLRRAQEDMYAWRAQQEIQDAQRWESERMRQEDRLGRIISQLEAQRGDRLILDAKLRVLEEQLSHERRRGFAQLGVLMMVIAIGAATRSETIERLMKPLLAEASRRRRRFTFSADLGKKSGNLAEAAAGVECDQGYRTGEEKEAEAMLRSNSMGHKRTNGGTPNSSMRRRHRPDHHAPRASLPARYTPRKLARTSHLHPMHGQGAQMSDNTASTDGSPYARSPLSPLGPQL